MTQVDLAQRLVDALVNHVPLPEPDRADAPTIEEAYRVQQQFVERWCASQSTAVAGYKIAAADRASQERIQADGPVLGVLFAESIVPSPAELAISDFFRPLLETELIFLIDRDLSIGAGREEIVDGARVAAGYEVPDSRYVRTATSRQLVASELICDNTGVARIVVGDAVPASDLDLTRVTMELRFDGELIRSGEASTAMGDPAAAVAWLTNRLASQGQALRAGMAVASGTFTPPFPAEPGRYEVVFSGVGSATVTFAE